MNILKDKRGAFLAQDWIIALILFSGVMALLGLFTTSLANEYGASGIIDPSIDAKYNKLEESTQIVDQAFARVSEKGGLTLVGAFDIVFASAFSIISLVFNSFGILAQLTTNFASDFGVPTQVANIIFPMFISIIVIIIVFVVINSTTRKDL